MNYALKTLKSPSADENTPPPAPPAGTVLEKFATRAGRTISYTRNAASKPGTRVDVKLNPFGYAVDDANVVITGASTRSITNREKILKSALVTTLKWKADTFVGGTIRRGFVPAKAIFFQKLPTQTETKSTSKITGLKYNPVEGDSYTLPFGATATGDTEKEGGMRAAIIADLQAGVSVSFTAERL